MNTIQQTDCKTALILSSPKLTFKLDLEHFGEQLYWFGINF